MLKVKNLKQEVLSISQSIDGTVGVYTYNLDRAFSFAQNESELFYLASTYKLPIIVQCLRRVDNGQIRLDHRVDISHRDVPKSSAILDHRHFSYPGVSLSIENLMRLMIEYSDNTASDIILNLGGGISQVKKFLNEFGYSKEISIDLSTSEIFIEEELFLKSSPSEVYPKDSGTPHGMARFLGTLVQGKFLKENSTRFLLECMRRCKTGNQRIRSLLPQDVIVANKTGTTTGYVNDVGMLELPEGMGRLILAIFIKETTASRNEAEAVIGRIARVIFDYIIKG